MGFLTSLRVVALAAIAVACVRAPVSEIAMPDCEHQPVPSVQIRGVVRDTSGAPIKGARVSVGTRCDWHAVTDARGQYILQAAPVGQVRLLARYVGYWGEAMTMRVDPVAHKVLYVDFVLEAQPIQYGPIEDRAPN